MWPEHFFKWQGYSYMSTLIKCFWYLQKMYDCLAFTRNNWEKQWHCFAFIFFSFFKKKWKETSVVWFTSTSRKSWSFLHVAEKVSEVPNSKYHSLFFVLKETRQRELQRDQEERRFPHIKIWSWYSHDLLFFFVYMVSTWQRDRSVKACLSLIDASKRI